MSPPGGRHRNPLDPDVIRRFVLAGADFAQVRRGVTGWPGETGTEHLTVTAGQDVDVHVTTADGMQLVARLFAPGGLWALPPLGDEVLVLAQEGDWHTIGAPVALWRHRGPPANVTATRAVLQVPSGGLYIGDGATKNAARVDDATRNGTLAIATAPATGGVAIVLTYTPPGGAPQTAQVVIEGLVTGAGGGALTLAGAIDPNAAKTRIE